MLVSDGSQAGTLGGGCVEAEVKRRSLFLLNDGQPEIVTFHLDDTYGWDDGLMSGGPNENARRYHPPGGDAAYYEVLTSRAAEGQGFTEAIVLDPEVAGGYSADRWLIDKEKVVAHRCQAGAARRPLVERQTVIATAAAVCGGRRFVFAERCTEIAWSSWEPVTSDRRWPNSPTRPSSMSGSSMTASNTATRPVFHSQSGCCSDRSMSRSRDCPLTTRPSVSS